MTTTQKIRVYRVWFTRPNGGKSWTTISAYSPEQAGELVATQTRGKVTQIKEGE